MTKVVKLLLMLALAASVLFQSSAYALMVGCHQGSGKSVSSDLHTMKAKNALAEHCAEHQRNSDTDAQVSSISSYQAEEDRSCCSCEAACKARIGIPVLVFDLIKTQAEYVSSFFYAFPNGVQAPLYRPPIFG